MLAFGADAVAASPDAAVVAASIRTSVHAEDVHHTGGRQNDMSNHVRKSLAGSYDFVSAKGPSSRSSSFFSSRKINALEGGGDGSMMYINFHSGPILWRT